MDEPVSPPEKLGWAEFLLKNFATPVAFYITFNRAGPKPAIGIAVGVTLLLLFVHWALKLRLSPFFIVASAFTLLFGGMDLLIESPRYFRLEPFVQNFLLAVLFLVTALYRRPIASWFADALPSAIRPDLDEVARAYLHRLTLIWSAYFLLKSLLFLYLAFRVNLGELVVLRTVIGGGSLLLMFGAELAYRKWLWRQKR